ncbi:MAG: transcription-repair coupling factor [Bacteroidales bacterium]|nr:transcription-repair coupling factor [Bacteroidales bacterium]
MNIQELATLFNSHSGIQKTRETLSKKPSSHTLFQGLHGSEISFLTGNIFPDTQNILFITSNAEDAAYFYSDLTSIIGAKKLIFFPSSYKHSILHNQPDRTNQLLRTEALDKLSDNKNSYIVVTYPEAILEQVITTETFADKKHILHTGEEVDTQFIQELLYEFGFEQVDFVVEPGQFSVRGSIIDIFSFSHDYPFRIDFWDTEIDSIRTFSVDDQRSIETVDDCSIISDIQQGKEKKYIPIFTYSPHFTVCIEDAQTCMHVLTDVYTHTIEKTDEKDFIRNTIMQPEVFHAFLEKSHCIEFNQTPYFPDATIQSCSTIPQPSIKKNFSILEQQLQEYQENGYKTFFITQSTTQVERMSDIFSHINAKVQFEPIISSLHKGFIDNDLRICCYTDHEIFERYHKHSVKKRVVSSDSFNIQDIKSLSPGDYIVHIDHGIGTFSGLEKVETNGKKQEAVKLTYRENGIVYVNIHNLHKISKYKGKEGIPPKIHKLGSGIWQKTKAKAKAKVKDIAKDLIALYAKRISQKGFAFNPDTYLQQELEASFFFEDTPDQVSATQNVKEAMEKSYPMDMLVCGDVGFGKTEVAIRAAYKSVTDGKQVAVLVPTTILALQHFKTFRSRLKEYGCTVDYICRLRTAKEQKISITNLKEGKTDILIGTHRIIGKDIKFKDLGLLIIDEEQKFGVRIKEQLKQLKVNVDTLTLTATPIPRTLQFSLMGARDLSIIKTAPPNRHPIITETHTFQESIIKEAILNEVQRDGQVFIINNRIQNIYEIEALVNRICPKVRTIVGHGQMEGKKLEQIMLDFINNEYDVLIATTIIESGLDIPNTNTIIINDAHQFGLSDLHQLRGRVGRSNKKAFCYLLAPPKHVLTREARQRLQAIEDFSELGSGFNIAMQDLDIRGAGNLLGAEQSGFITDIGYETYQKILQEALLELRETEYKDLYSETNKAHSFTYDCHIETDMELVFPAEYISSTKERVKMYRELDTIESEEELCNFQDQLTDRFGIIPEESISLINVVRLRWIAIQLGIERIVIKNKHMRVYFIGNQESAFYQSETFTRILSYVQMHQRSCDMKELRGKLTLRFKNVPTIEYAIKTLQNIHTNNE